ncbi:hypothetical protein D9M69_593640 [compost metagenome]
MVAVICINTLGTRDALEGSDTVGFGDLHIEFIAKKMISQGGAGGSSGRHFTGEYQGDDTGDERDKPEDKKRTDSKYKSPLFQLCRFG